MSNRVTQMREIQSEAFNLFKKKNAGVPFFSGRQIVHCIFIAKNRFVY